MDAQHFPFYIISSNYVRSILFYQNKDHNARQIRFHVCTKMHCKRRVCKRKTLFGQPNMYEFLNKFRILKMYTFDHYTLQYTLYTIYMSNLQILQAL